VALLHGDGLGDVLQDAEFLLAEGVLLAVYDYGCHVIISKFNKLIARGTYRPAFTSKYN
jgi:hypothetical protein